jgi:hypothetical protein
LEDVVGDALSEFDGIAVQWRKRLEDAFHRLNSATLHVQGVLQDYHSRAVPSSDDDLAFRKALWAETQARHEYMSVAMTLQDLVLHGKIPMKAAAKVMVKNSDSA